MPAEAAQKVEALAAQAQRLMATFTRADYEQIAPAIIQPAGLFLDVIGENLRARTYVFTDPDGEELCLRPDLTVPTCRLHLARHPAGDVPARYCYSGPAFRYQPGGPTSAHPSEFRQAGIESFAATDREKDDAAVLALTVEAVREAGLARFDLRLGDLGLFNALLDALPMPQRWRRRLRHHFWRPEAFRAELARLTSREALQARGVPRELMDALDPDRPEAAPNLVEGYLERSGLELVGTRTAHEIAGRLLAEAADARETPLPSSAATLIEGYTALKAPAREAAARLEALLGPHKLDLGAALAAFRRRLDLLDAAGIDTTSATFAAEFGRDLEYYTGFVFEIVVPELGPRSPVAGGGRYDDLLADVGAPTKVPAVGACIHTERLLAVLGGGAA
ncbi:MAG TPA: ATP phosphoribosyltransferase regulatory subunit [Hyphomicrobiaceae bacterium]|nr:ATP phosphoribosyltransferase regulatory subunit [Hyphomicrobiaceae bacterium]